MSLKSRTVLSVILTGIWVNACEFVRNEVLLKRYWVDHYQSLGVECHDIVNEKMCQNIVNKVL